MGFLQYSPHRHRWLLALASAIVVFNLFDAVMTLLVVHAGAANEANPLMASALSWGSVWFMVIKLSLVSLSVLLLWRLRHRRAAGVALFATSTGYALLVFIVHARSVSAIAHL